MHALHDPRDLEGHQTEEGNAEDGRQDLLLLRLRLEGIDVLLRHQGAPVADAPLGAVSVGDVVLAEVVVGAVAVGSVGVVTMTGAGAPALYTNASMRSEAWICGNLSGLSLKVRVSTEKRRPGA